MDVDSGVRNNVVACLLRNKANQSTPAFSFREFCCVVVREATDFGDIKLVVVVVVVVVS